MSDVEIEFKEMYSNNFQNYLLTYFKNLKQFDLSDHPSDSEIVRFQKIEEFWEK